MKKVLLVDDVGLFLEMEKTILNRPNLQVFTTTSGPEALEVHRREKVDLILLDMYMPGMNGDEVCRVIRGDDGLKGVSIIMVTTSSKGEDVDRCMRAGANDYITKPINSIELLKKVNKFINIPLRQDLRIMVKLGLKGRTGENRSFLVNTVNISVSGILIEAEEELKVHDVITCTFFLPKVSSPISVSGEVVRRAQVNSPALRRYGIRFLDMTKGDKEAIEGFIKRYQPF